MKTIILIIKKIVVALFMLYTINLIINQSGVIIPINIYSIALVSLLGLPAVIALLVLQFLIM